MVSTRFVSSAEEMCFLPDCVFPEMAANCEPVLRRVSTGQRAIVWAFGNVILQTIYPPAQPAQQIALERLMPSSLRFLRSQMGHTWVGDFIGYYPREPSSPKETGLAESCMPHYVALATTNMLPCGFNKFTCTNRDKQILGHLKAYSYAIIDTLNYYEEESAYKRVMQILHLWLRHRMLASPGQCWRSNPSLSLSHAPVIGYRPRILKSPFVVGTK